MDDTTVVVGLATRFGMLFFKSFSGFEVCEESEAGGQALLNNF